MAKGFWGRRLAVQVPQVEARSPHPALSWQSVQEMYTTINGVQYYTPYKSQVATHLMCS